MDWLATIEHVFNFKDIAESKKVKLVGKFEEAKETWREAMDHDMGEDEKEGFFQQLIGKILSINFTISNNMIYLLSNTLLNLSILWWSVMS